jgi:uncharacterized damage-inducible protein DinB
MRGYGMEVDVGQGVDVAWDARRVKRYFAYQNWATGKVLDLAANLDDGALDRPFEMGMGSIRKTLLHLHDAERWWLANWTVGPTRYENSPPTTRYADLRKAWASYARQRDEFIARLDKAGSQRVVAADVGPMRVDTPVIESLVQLCGHGTHHRAQLVNMLRHSGTTAPPLDYIVWVGEEKVAS